VRGGLVAVVLAACLAVAGSAAAAGDPAEGALARSAAYASPRALGAGADESQARLAAAAAALAKSGHPAKIAVVLGPAGAPSLAVYARRLRKRLHFAGIVAVATPGGRTAAAGPLRMRRIVQALQRGGVGEVLDPTARAMLAARLVAGAAPAGHGRSRTRELVALLLLAGVGGAWAGAVGVRRERRRAERRLADERARARLRLDALGARAADLAAREPSDPALRELIACAEDAHERAREAIDAAGDAEAVRRALGGLEEGLAAVAAAARRMGEPIHSAEDPFAGLCALDPAHGPAIGQARAAGAPEPLPACAGCADAAARGERLARRLAPSIRDGRPVPFAEAHRS